MKKSTLLKLVSLVICAMMLLSMFAACVDQPEETDASGTDPVTDPKETDPKETDPKETTPGESTDTPPEQSTDTPPEESTDTPPEESTDTPPAPTCDGDHTPDYDEEGHWRDACEEHGIPAADKAPHSYRVEDDGTYCCSVCKYEPACKGDHWVKDAAGHSQPACADCGFAGDPEAAGEHEYDEDLVCTICEYAPECYGEHEYEASGADGHIVKACEYCGAAAGELEPHSIVEDFEEVGGDKVYTYFCSLCEYVIKTRTIPADVNAYLSGVELASSAAYQSKASIVQGAYHLDFDGRHSQHIWLREAYLHPNGSGTMAGGGSTMSEKIDAGKAQYMVVRVKTNSAALVGGAKFQIYLSTTGWNYDTEGVTGNGAGSVCKDMNFQVSEADTWTVFAADLTTIEKFVVPDADGNYIFDTFYFNYSGNKAEEYLELDYVAFVDNWDEAKALFTEEDTIIRKVLDFSGNIELLNADGTAHICVDADANNACDQCGAHVHSYKTLANKCDVCGEISEHTCVDTDADAEHLCDLCGNCAHAYTALANKCDYCGAITAHTCADATDPKDYKCDLCGEHVHGYSTLANKCDGCGEISKHDCVDADVNTSCDLCGGYVAPPATGDYIVNNKLTGADLNVGGAYQGKSSLDETDGFYRLTATKNNTVEQSWICEAYHTTAAGTLGTGQAPTAAGDANIETIDIGSAKYIVLKLRTNGFASFSLQLGTTTFTHENQTAGNRGGILDNLTIKPTSEWTVYVISLDLWNDKVAADANGNRVIDTMRISTSAAALDATLDIEYIAFVDDLNEVGLLTGDATVKRVTDKKGTVEDIAITAPELGDGQVNATLPVDKMLDLSGNSAITAISGGSLWKVSGAVTEENTFKVVGTEATPTGAEFHFLRDAADHSAGKDTTEHRINVGDAKYVVVKIKTNIASVGINFSTTGKSSTDPKSKRDGFAGVSMKPTADTWEIFVIDVSSLLSSVWVKDATADDYIIDCFYFGLGSITTEQYVEVEYIAFVDEWAEVSLVTGTATVNKVVDTKGSVEMAQVTAVTPEA